MKCPFCNKENPAGAKFCKFCGKSLKQMNFSGNNSETRKNPEHVVPAGKDTKGGKAAKKKMSAVIIAAAAAVIIIAVIAIMFLKQGDKTGSSDADYYYQEIDADRVLEEGTMHYVESQILLAAAETASFDEVEDFLKDYRAEIVGYLSFTNDYQVDLAGEYLYDELEDLCAEIEQSELIESADIALVEELATDSVDYTSDPWINADDTADTSGSDWDEDNPDGLNWWAEAIGMPSVWEMDSEIETVKVGIIDTMFDISNEDLDEGLFAQLWNNPEDEEGNCTVTQLYEEYLANLESNPDETSSNTYHGTHVAGIIAAQAGNGFGIAGVNSNVELYGYATKSEAAENSSEATWGSAFTWKYALALMLNEDVKVINISMGFNQEIYDLAESGDEDTLELIDSFSSVISDFLLKYINAGYEFLICKSAGNEASDAAYDMFGAIENETVADRIIIVGNAQLYNGHYYINSSSNTGDRVDVYAPGTDILSDMPGNVTQTLTGTSMAAPVVAGIVSLIWGINPDLSADQVKSIILASTSASLFQEEDQGWFEGLAAAEYTLTPIVNAYISVQLALSTAGGADNTDLSFGTVTGVIYTQAADGSAQNGIIDGVALSIYDENNGLCDVTVTEMKTWELLTYTALLEPGTYTIEVSADGYETQTLTVTVKEGETVQLDLAMVQEASDIFSQLPDTFTFTSGAGAWATEIYINDDGTFTGYYHDSDMGVTGDGYPGGTVYICEFSGKFTDPVQVDEYTYSMELEYLDIETEGDPYIEDEILYVPSGPYGFDDADEFLIYLPGSVLSDLPEEFLSWSFISADIRTTIPSGVYGIYNVNGQEGFIGTSDDCFWDNDYRYEYEETYSEIWPSYYTYSHIVFFPDSSSAASISLNFAWSEDDQSIFYAEDSRGSGDYEIEITFDEDKNTAQVTITSLDGSDLSAYGGTSSGTLTAEYYLVEED